MPKEMKDFDFSKLGKQISDSVTTALQSKEVQDLKDNVKNTFQTAMNGVKEKVNEVPYAPPKKKLLPVVKNPKGKVSGILMTVFGSIGTSLFGISNVILLALVVAGAISLVTHTTLVLTAGVLLLSSVMFLSLGIKRLAILSRYKKYLKTLGYNEFCEVKQLACNVEKKEKYVIRDLKKMTKRGWFLEGNFDEQKTCFIVTKEAYQQYVSAEEERKRREEAEERRRYEERIAQEELQRAQSTLWKSPQGKELAEVIEEGQRYIAQIRKANDDILGEEISQKLDRLELISRKIFEHIQNNPEKLPEMRKFLNYYFPTTLKMVNAYQEFDKQPVQGDNIKTGKREIEEGLDDVNEAFEKLFDQLFQEEMLDISTDISVMSTMLSGDGLIHNEFES